MLAKLFSTLLLVALPLIGLSQDIASWQQTHPQILFIEVNDLNHMEDDVIASLGDNVIIYQEEITYSDIEAFEFQSKSNSQEAEVINGKDDAELQFIKEWMARNPDIKLIKRSYFDSLDAARKKVYKQPNALILIGERITSKDIHLYEGAN